MTGFDDDYMMFRTGNSKVYTQKNEHIELYCNCSCSTPHEPDAVVAWVILAMVSIPFVFMILFFCSILIKIYF